MLPQLIQHLLNVLYVLFVLVLSVDEDVIKIDYHENVKLLYQDLVDIVLKHDRCIGQSKRYDLIFKVTIAGPESHLQFIVFLNLYLMVGISQIKLGEMSSPT